MRRLWIWDNGDYGVFEDNQLPLDRQGQFLDDEIKRGKLWMELVENSPHKNILLGKTQKNAVQKA